MEALWIFILTLMQLLLLVLTQNTPAGFINIDCGLVNGETQDDQTGLTYTPDVEYVESGEIYTISDQYINSNLVDQFKTLRAFPNGTRNCYTVKHLIPGDKYLMRATFFHGNYDSKFVSGISTVSFNLSLGSQLLSTLLITAQIDPLTFEVLTIAQTSYMSVCLINIGAGTPFISILELRQLKNTLYPALVKGLSLKTLSRLNLGGNKDIIRYGDDPYDRKWLAANSDDCSSISTSSFINNGIFEVPSSVLQTAVTPKYPNPNPSPNLIVNLRNIVNQDVANRHVYMSFTRFNPTSLIKFNVLEDGDPIFTQISLPYLRNYVASLTNLTGSNHIFTLVPTSDSDLIPVLNALEIYAVMNGSDCSDQPTSEQDFYALMAIKDQYKVKKNWMGDPCSPKYVIWEGLACNYGSSNSTIQKVDLSSSGLTGEINASFGDLTSIVSLDLSLNSLTGSIPDFLASMSSLRYLNLSANNLSGTIPLALLERSKNNSLGLSIEGNPNLCTDDNKCKNNKQLKPAMIIVIVVLIVLLLLLTPTAWMLKRLGFCSRESNKQTTESTRGNLGQFDSQYFAYKDLEKVTDNFKQQIGKGGFGKVYLGSLLHGIQVAVKVLDDSSHQGVKEFEAEVLHLSRVHHKNLVSLLGYCNDRVHMALVYEYMSEGSLHASIRGNAKKRVLSWEHRVRILLEASQGISYLHCECNPPIVHRDVKTENILLNELLEAKIADFGLSKAFQNNCSHIFTERVVGTMGYLDPEYQCGCQLNEKSDVYSFGVVLLEVLTAKPPIIGPYEKNIHLTEWVRQKLAKGSMDDVADIELLDRYDVNSAWKIVDLAMACCARTSAERPTMSEVVSQLKECLDLVHDSKTTRRAGSVGTSSSGRVALEMEKSDDSLLSNGPSMR